MSGKRMRALFAAELGAGYGNVAPLIGVAEALEALGIEPVFAIADGVTPAGLFANHPHWLRLPAPANPTPLKSRAGPTGYGDMLALMGFAEADELAALLAQWDAIFALVEPAFVIGSHAPGAALAARERLPVGLIGTGFTLPPHHTGLFPALRPDTASLRPEGFVISCVNQVLKARGAAPLPSLPALLDVTARAVFSIAALDPYASVRAEPYVTLAPAPRPAAPIAEGVFAFLDMRGKEAVRAVDILGAVAEERPVAAHLRGPGWQAAAGYMERRGATVHRTPADLDEALQKAKVVVTQGGHGMALTTLQRGRYGLVLPMHFESMLNGLALERLSAGKVAWGGESETIAAHLDGLLAQDIARPIALAQSLAPAAPFDAAAFLAALAPDAQRRGKPSAAKPRRGQRSQGSVGGGEAGSSYSSAPSMKPAA